MLAALADCNSEPRKVWSKDMGRVQTECPVSCFKQDNFSGFLLYSRTLAAKARPHGASLKAPFGCHHCITNLGNLS